MRGSGAAQLSTPTTCMYKGAAGREPLAATIHRVPPPCLLVSAPPRLCRCRALLNSLFPSPSSSCRFGEVAYQPRYRCPRDYDDVLCGGGTGQNTCNGDSGGWALLLFRLFRLRRAQYSILLGACRPRRVSSPAPSQLAPTPEPSPQPPPADAGGPLILRDPTTRAATVLGVTSHGPDCLSGPSFNWGFYTGASFQGCSGFPWELASCLVSGQFSKTGLLSRCGPGGGALVLS